MCSIRLPMGTLQPSRLDMIIAVSMSFSISIRTVSLIVLDVHLLEMNSKELRVIDAKCIYMGQWLHPVKEPAKSSLGRMEVELDAISAM
jgi:hypothetical protein